MLVILDAGSLFIREDDGHTTMVICGSSLLEGQAWAPDLSIAGIIPTKSDLGMEADRDCPQMPLGSWIQDTNRY